MKLDEIHTTGTTDNEDLGDHERTQAVVVSHISFAHEPGLEEAFKQLMGLPAFANALEKSFTEAFRRQVYEFVRQSSIEPGNGWTDAYETTVQVS